MAAFVDPYEGMLSFQQALREGILQLSPCATDANLFVHGDQPDGMFRLSYAHISGREVTALASFVRGVSSASEQRFQLAYAVPPALRGQGRAKAVVRAAIIEMRQSFTRAAPKALLIAAVVRPQDLAAQHVAAAVLAQADEPFIDEATGKPVLFYSRSFQVVAGSA
jgi:GNAT superfamily N-acetyltransferase